MKLKNEKLYEKYENWQEMSASETQIKKCQSPDVCLCCQNVKLGHGKFNQDSFSVFTVLGSNQYYVALMPNCKHNVVFIKGTEESAKKKTSWCKQSSFENTKKQ